MKYKLTNLAPGALIQSAREYDNTFCRYETSRLRIQFVCVRQDMIMSS